MRKKRVNACAWLSLCVLLVSADGLTGQEAGAEKDKDAAPRISPEQFRIELARAQADIELLRRALKRKQNAEKLAMDCREALRAAEEKLDQLRRESTAELAQRKQRIGVLEARVEASKKQLEQKGDARTATDVEKLKGELDAKIRELTAAQKNAGRLAGMLEQAVVETGQLRKAREKSATDLAEARKGLKELTRKSGDESKKLKEENKKLGDEKSALDKKLAAANKDKGDLTKARDKHKKDLDQARKDLNAAFALMKRDRKLKEEAIAKNVEKIKELAAAGERQVKSEAAIVKLKTEKQAALIEINELKRKLNGQSNNDASRERIEKLEGQMRQAETLAARHAELEIEQERALRQLIDAGVMIQQLAAQRDEARAQLESAVTSQKEAEEKAEESLNAALEKALSEKAAAEEQRDALRKRVDADQNISDEIKAACERAERNLIKLKRELSSGNKVADTLGDKLRRAADTLAKLRQEKAVADRNIAALGDKLESERRGHQSQLAGKDAQLVTLRSKLAGATASSNRRQRAYVDAGDYINQLLREQKGEARSRLAAELALSEASEVIRELLAGQDQFKKQVSEAKHLLSREKASGGAAARSLSNAAGRIARLERGLADATTKLKENQAALAGAWEAASELSADKIAVEETLQDTARVLRDLVAKLNAQQTQLADLGATLESEQSGRADERKALASAREEVAKLSTALEQQRKVSGDAARNAVAVAAALATLKTEKGAGDRKLAELAASLEAANETNANLAAKFDASEKALAARAAELKDLRVAFKELESRRGAATEALEESNKLIRDLLAAKEACDARIAELTAAGESRQVDLTSVRAELKTEKEARRAALGVKAETEKQLAGLSRELDTRRQALAAANQAGQVLAAQLKSLSGDRDSIAGERAALGKSLRAEQARVLELREQVARSGDAFAARTAEVDRLNTLLNSAQSGGIADRETLLDSAAFIRELLARRASEQDASEEGRGALNRELAGARDRITTLEDEAAEIERIRAHASDVEGGKLHAEVALKDAATFIGELLELRDGDASARRAAEKALLKLKGDFEGVEKQAEELRRKLNDLDQLKIKKAEAEDRLSKLERERARAGVATDSALTVVRELRGARVDALTARQTAESAFHAAALELGRLRTEVTGREREFRNLLAEKERVFEKQSDEQQLMLVMANNRLGEVDNRLQMAIEERHKAEMTAAEGVEVLDQLRAEKTALDGRIGELKGLVAGGRNHRAARADELEQLTKQLAEVVLERDTVELARQAAEENAVTMGGILSRQTAEIEASRLLATEFAAMKSALDLANTERNKLAAELERAMELSAETIALKEALATQESNCRGQLNNVLGKLAEREEQVAELEASANQAKVLQAELDKLKGAGDASLEQALARAAEYESKAKAGQEKAAMYQQALRDSEAAVEVLAAKVKEVDTAHSGALDRIRALESALGKAKDDKAKALRAALDVKEKLLRIDPIWYALNSASIEEEQARVLNQAKAIRAQYPDARFDISGHTCTIGSREANQRLSESRANGLADFLAANGIPRASITHKGFGPARPVADNATEEGRRRNRRVEIDATISE